MSNNHDAPPGDTVQVKGTGVQGGGTQSLEGGYTLKLGTDKIIGNGSFVSPPGRRPPADPPAAAAPTLRPPAASLPRAAAPPAPTPSPRPIPRGARGRSPARSRRPGGPLGGVGRRRLPSSAADS